jgi:hypothetical protein
LRLAGKASIFDDMVDSFRHHTVLLASPLLPAKGSPLLAGLLLRLAR